MGRYERIKPISYLKAHSAEVIRELNDGAPPLIITQNGEARAVLVDMGTWEQTQETLALLKLLAMSEEDVERDAVVPIEGLAERIREGRVD